MNNDSGRVPGSHASHGASISVESPPIGFDPARIGELAEKAAALLACEHRTNRPNQRGDGGRVVGFVLDSHDMIGLGLSEPLFAWDAVIELARAAILAATALEKAEEALEREREMFGLMDKLLCSAIEHGFYIGEGLLEQVAAHREALSHIKGQSHD